MRVPGLIGKTVAIAAAALSLATPGHAYYHYIRYLNVPSGNGPFTPVYQKFDLSRLSNRTVNVFVSDNGPSTYGTNDSFGSVLSQIRQAAAAWNAVDASDLRVAFGGLESENQVSNTPGIDVVFSEVPGVLGFTAVTPAQAAVNGPSGPFFPITRSITTLTRDTSQDPGPSYLEKFFTTTVHELGHALGLQHTYTSSAMSQGVVRNTTRTRPLDADDYAGLAVLYGKPGWNAGLGSISGRVTTTNGQPIGLASVVAIVKNGSAVSALTDPNGNYRIEGLQPNSYLLYVHPLPPDANVTFPADASGQPYPQTVPYFESTFYPGTRDLQTASDAAIQVTPGAAITGRNFSLQTRSSVPVYNVVTYSQYDPGTRAPIYSGSVQTYPAFINSNQAQGLLIARARPPVPTPVPQSVTLLGGFTNANVTAYDTPVALACYFNMPLFAGTGPRHLVMIFDNDMYVLPDAVTLVQRNAPVVNSVTSNADGTATISGAGLASDSQVYFDGLPATITVPFNGNDTRGTVTVMPPPGGSGHVATITVYNTDGQNSMILQSANPPTYTYENSGQEQIQSISASALPSGANGATYSSMIDLTVSNMRLVDGQVTLGFGSDDVTVRRVWVLSPARLAANLAVAPGAAISSSEISVISGFQVARQPFGFQTQPPNPRAPQISLPLVNGNPNQQTLYPGAAAVIYGANLAPVPGAVQLSLNDQPVPVRFAGSNQINFDIPANFPTGLAQLKLNNGADTATVLVSIDNQPPVILGFTNVSNVAVTQTFAGDTINLLVGNLDPSVIANPSRVRVTIQGVDMFVQRIGQSVIQVVVTQSFTGAQVPVQVIVDGSASLPVTILAR